MNETLQRTGVGQLQLGQPVNLERATTPTGLVGGHIVAGRADGQAEVLAVRPTQHWTLMVLRLPHELSHYVAEKGSIALDGVSLTVVSVADRDVTVSLIPTTLRDTTLGAAVAGDTLNLEVDVLARYIQRQLAAGVGLSPAWA
jgi:riboflavin synthase